MTKHRRINIKTRKRTQKGGFELSNIVEPIKNTSISVVNAAENGLTNASVFFENAWSSTKNAWSSTKNAFSNFFYTNTSSTSYTGGKRRRRRHSHRRKH